MPTKLPPQPLVYTRAEVRSLLGCSATLLRSLESQGRLTPISLGTGACKRGVRYRVEQVHGLLRAPSPNDKASDS
jgi:hypothetical protein